MFLRTPSERTISDLAKTMVDVTGRDDVDDFTVTFGDDPMIEAGGKEYPGTPGALRSVFDRYDIPYKPVERWRDLIGDKKVATLVNEVIRRSEKESVIEIGGSRGAKEIVAIHPPTSMWLPPKRLVESVAKAVGENAKVGEGDFGYDPNKGVTLKATVEEGNNPYWYDGGEAGVGDLVGAGVVVHQPLVQAGKQYRRPTVTGRAFRLACTNGYEWEDQVGVGTVTGDTIDEVLASVEELAQEYLGRAEDFAKGLFDLRNNPVPRPEQYLMRTLTEASVPTPVQYQVLERVPELPNDEVTEFDLINLITNEAVNPDVTNDRTRQLLERSGGGIVHEHVSRCAHCQSRLVD